MNEGALTLTTDKLILYANSCFAKMVQRPLEQVIGTSFREFLAPEDAVPAAREAAALALAKGMHGLRISAEVLLARALVGVGDAAAALPRARIALALAETYQPDFVDAAEVGQVAYQVLTLNGESGDAVLRSTVDWIQQTTARHVPAEFRDSFMHRNPVNRDLLAAASRLGTQGTLLR